MVDFSLVEETEEVAGFPVSVLELDPDQSAVLERSLNTAGPWTVNETVPSGPCPAWEVDSVTRGVASVLPAEPISNH